jgi:hypothetical protein
MYTTEGGDTIQIVLTKNSTGSGFHIIYCYILLCYREQETHSLLVHSAAALLLFEKSVYSMLSDFSLGCLENGNRKLNKLQEQHNRKTNHIGSHCSLADSAVI